MRTLLIIASLALASCASGTSLVTGQSRAPIPAEQVRIYLEPPASYEVVGAVSAVSRLGINAQANLDNAIADVRERAAAMGANGVLLDYQGVPVGGSGAVATTSGGVTSIIPTGDGGDREVRGRAIFVSE
jgi:hypothetical protein